MYLALPVSISLDRLACLAAPNHTFIYLLSSIMLPPRLPRCLPAAPVDVLLQASVDSRLLHLGAPLTRSSPLSGSSPGLALASGIPLTEIEIFLT